MRRENKLVILINHSALDITVKSIDMKQFKVYYNNNVEVNFIKDFDTFKEAKRFCADSVKGYDEVCDNDNSYEGRGNNFHYEVFDGDYEKMDENGEVVEINDPIYTTKRYYL